MVFPISGVEAPFWLPVIVSFLISSLTSMGGVSGAFLLLPFQISVLGFIAPGVTPTNLLFNTFAIPAGVYRYAKEKRVIWGLLLVLSVGTILGAFIGVIIRIKYLPDPRNFKIFVGFVLCFVAYKLLKDILSLGSKCKHQSPIDYKSDFSISKNKINLKRVAFDFNAKHYKVSTILAVILGFFIGLVSGIYGIGGGAIMSPMLVVMFCLPVYAIAGVTLFNSFITSLVGIIFYLFIGPHYSVLGQSVHPDWLLGLFLGIGGFAGIYAGSRLQKYVPAIIIKIILAVTVSFISIKYILGLFK